MRETKVDVTISKVLNCIPVVVWSLWKNVNSSDNALNETKFKIPLLCCLQFNITSDLVPGFSGEGLDNCHSKCCVVNTDREEGMHLSKKEA